jgi:hypothetical protein
MKKCTKCGEKKPLDEFYRRIALKSGYRSECKSCSDLHEKSVRKGRKLNPVQPPKSKICPRCSKRKSSDKFYNNVGKSSGLHSLCKECSSSEQALNRDAEKSRWKMLLKKYDITQEAYYKLLSLQDNGCAVCGSKTPQRHGAKYFFVDHDHETGKIRSLLCHCCNYGLGMFKDDPECLEAAADYLRKHKHAH